MEEATVPDKSQPSPDLPPAGSVVIKLVAVPLLIVTLIVGGAITVVILFGRISAEQDRSVSDLLAAVESPHGEKLLDVALMPRDKEIWQAARELAMRLDKKEVEVTPAELSDVVQRLSALSDRMLASARDLGKTGVQKFEFVLAALARTDRPEAIAAIVRCLDCSLWEVRRSAVQALASMHQVEGVRDAALGPICRLAGEDPEPVVRTVSAYALSFVADPSDAAAIDVLTGICTGDESDREVIWNAALSLARLGSPAGRSELRDMLDRTYWSEKVPMRVEQSPGQFVEAPMSASRVDEHLIAAIDAVSHLEDEELWSLVRGLERDPSLSVVHKVREVLEKRPSDGGA
ncbi:MAG: HEAT repeat domain-containing protein [Phycisphaerales bacterium]|nr:MAG: HEAT repeat domain-containing protein [Phycisphaerales bacterium]